MSILALTWTLHSSQVFAGPQDILINSDLKNNSEIFDVSGRQGWNFDQVIKFGDYSSSPVQRGFPEGKVVFSKLTGKISTAKEKLNYTQNAPSGKSAIVVCATDLDKNALNDFKNLAKMRLGSDETFAGSIVIEDKKDDTKKANAKNASKNVWNFLVTNPDESLSQEGEPITGYIKSESGTMIDIRAVKKMEQQFAGMPNISNYGFQFYLNKKAIAAIATLNSGKVYFLKGISDDQKLIVASMATGLLLRSSMRKVTKEQESKVDENKQNKPFFFGK